MNMEVYTGVVLLDNKQRIYLIKEDDKNKIGQNRWNLPGGSVDGTEGIVDSAYRETLEETGYKAKIGSIIGLYQATKKGAFWIYIVVSGKVTSFKKSPVSDTSVKDGRWFTKKEFLKMDNSLMVHPDMKLVYEIAIGNKGLDLKSVKFINYDEL